jgi:hypothetical protein
MDMQELLEILEVEGDIVTDEETSRDEIGDSPGDVASSGSVDPFFLVISVDLKGSLLCEMQSLGFDLRDISELSLFCHSHDCDFDNLSDLGV